MDYQMFETYLKMSVVVVAVVLIAGFVVGAVDSICPLVAGAAVLFALYHVAKGLSSK